MTPARTIKVYCYLMALLAFVAAVWITWVVLPQFGVTP